MMRPSLHRWTSTSRNGSAPGRFRCRAPSAPSGEQLLATPELERYQLAFLDVDLKTTDGIALGRRLRQVAPDIVLVYISAYLEFALQGYTVNAYRYLLKRDIAAQLPSCLEDIFSGMSDPRKDAGGAP